MIRKGYRIEGDEKRRVIARKKGFRTKKEALESLPTLFSKKEREKNPTFRAIYEQWLPTHRAGKDTMNCYKAAMKYFREIEFFRLAEIDELAAGRTSGALFYNREDGRAFRIDKFRDQVFYHALEAIGIENPVDNSRHKYTPHSCRHTFATLMKRVNSADKDKQELIGHASPEMLRYYQDVNVDDLRKITDAI